MKVFNSMKLIDFLNLQYKPKKHFKYYDDYACYLYYDIFQMNEEEYYEQLEEDIKMFSDMQTGEERKKAGKQWNQKHQK